MSVESELRRANTLIAANRRLQAAAAALLAAKSLAELDRTLVDVVPGAIGFERVALLHFSAEGGEPRIVHALGYPPLDLSAMPKHSPLRPGGFLDGQRSGCEDDDDLPIAGVRGDYVLAPLRDRDRVAGALYADTLREEIETQDASAALAYALDLSAIVRANLTLTAQLAQMAGTDALTGLPNRRVFLERLEYELERSARSRRPFALAVFDLDRFKEINDGYGHPAGDEALCRFAATIRAQARHVDFVARFGGDEFAVLLIDIDRGASRTIVARLLDTIRSLPAIPLRLTASAGITTSFPVDTAETIVERADSALYDAKQNGRDCARFS